MPQIIVTADGPTDHGNAIVMWRERITPADLQSQHFTTQLIERLGWAVDDAEHADDTASPEDEDHHRRQRSAERRSASRVTTAS